MLHDADSFRACGVCRFFLCYLFLNQDPSFFLFSVSVFVFRHGCCFELGFSNVKVHEGEKQAKTQQTSPTCNRQHTPHNSLLFMSGAGQGNSVCVFFFLQRIHRCRWAQYAFVASWDVGGLTWPFHPNMSSVVRIQLQQVESDIIILYGCHWFVKRTKCGFSWSIMGVANRVWPVIWCVKPHMCWNMLCAVWSSGRYSVVSRLFWLDIDLPHPWSESPFHSHIILILIPIPISLMADIQKDWENREFIQNVQYNVLKIANFLNQFGEGDGDRGERESERESEKGAEGWVIFNLWSYDMVFFWCTCHMTIIRSRKIPTTCDEYYANMMDMEHITTSKNNQLTIKQYHSNITTTITTTT